MIEYNRVDSAKFRKKVGEGWWRTLDDLAKRLNKASELVGRKSNNERGSKEFEKKALD